MLLQFIRYLIAEQSRQGKRHESYSELKKKEKNLDGYQSAEKV